MWFLFSLIYLFLLALVHYLDEILVARNSIQDNATAHEKVGGVILASTMFSVLGAAGMLFFVEDVTQGSSFATWVAILSGVPSALTLVGFLYAISFFSVHLVTPLYLLTSIWLVAYEITTEGGMTVFALLAIGMTLLGAYLLDVGKIALVAPSKLVLIMLLVTFSLAVSMLMTERAVEELAPTSAYFLQLVGIFLTGLVLFVAVKTYRVSFFERAKKQPKLFLGTSLANELLFQASALFLTLAIAAAPFTSYVSAVEGLQSIFVLLLLFFFPITERSSINKVQTFSIFLIVLGAAGLAIGG